MIEDQNLTVTPDTQTIKSLLLVARKYNHALSNIVIPIYILSILVCFCYLIPPDSGERMSYLITIQDCYKSLRNTFMMV